VRSTARISDAAISLIARLPSAGRAKPKSHSALATVTTAFCSRRILSTGSAAMAANPRLREKPRNEKTRFKPWPRLIGSAIEYAASLAGKCVDFAELFQRTEEQDEEAASLAETLQHLDGLSEGRPFKAAQAVTWASAETDAGPALKSFFGGSASRPLSANGITRKLKANTDAPVMVGDAVWTLRADALSHTGVAQFGIDKRA
jgi:hypothetical protein